MKTVYVDAVGYNSIALGEYNTAVGFNTVFYKARNFTDFSLPIEGITIDTKSCKNYAFYITAVILFVVFIIIWCIL